MARFGAIHLHVSLTPIARPIDVQVNPVIKLAGGVGEKHDRRFQPLHLVQVLCGISRTDRSIMGPEGRQAVEFTILFDQRWLRCSARSQAVESAAPAGRRRIAFQKPWPDCRHGRCRRRPLQPAWGGLSQRRFAQSPR